MYKRFNIRFLHNSSGALDKHVVAVLVILYVCLFTYVP